MGGLKNFYLHRLRNDCKIIKYVTTQKKSINGAVVTAALMQD